MNWLTMKNIASKRDQGIIFIVSEGRKFGKRGQSCPIPKSEN